MFKFIVFGFLLTACGEEKETAEICTGGVDPDTLACTTADQSQCELTCVCEDGELDAGGCLNDTCTSVDVSCGTGCPNFGLGEWTGEFCSR